MTFNRTKGTEMILRFRLMLPLFAFLFVAAVGTSAQAATYCVNKSPCLEGTAYGADELQPALIAAGNTDAADKILIGPSAAAYQGPYQYSSESPLTIIGSGTEETVLASPVLGGSVLDLPVPNVEVRNLGIEVMSFSNLVGLTLRGTAREVAIRQVGDGSGTPLGLLMLKEGVFDAGSVRMLKGHAVEADGPGARRIEDSVLFSAGVAIDVTGEIDVVRSQIQAVSEAVYALGDEADVLLESDLIRTYSSGVQASNGASIDARHLTIVKTHASASPAIKSYGTVDGHTTSMKVSNSILSGFEVAARRDGKVDSPAALSIGYTAWTGVLEDGIGGGKIELLAGIRPGTEAEFVEPDPIDPLAAPNYRLATGSTLIDAGDPALTGSDLDGRERPLDGDGTGEAAPDLGAYEHPTLFIRTPETVPPATPPAGGPARAGIARAVVGRTGLKASAKGAVTVRVVCSAAGPCSGAIRLLSGRTPIAGEDFSLAAGTTSVLRLRLRARGRELLLAKPGLRTRVEVTSRQSDGTKVVRKASTFFRAA